MSKLDCGSNHEHYHISYFKPFKNEYVDWPNGGWSVYHISGDQIAERIRYDAETREVHERHSWCGYLGIAQSPQEAVEIIENHRRGKIAA